ncbi:venom carboxylesterase-6-like [Tribolium madens]|uniref:venom carboxylesterase-6-like n=1 Tax=Tribolium madens TaxID=41895 RepID=UPI001CF753D6|nr:venom carboxylesterase-6-like [Tribolium madens]
MTPTWFTLVALFALTHAERPMVGTPLGQLQGYHRKSAKRNVFAAFEGIPYAKPPIGSLRFEPPEPIDPWEGVWNASTIFECAQTTLMNPEVPQGDEDCLYLNVYVPRDHPDPSETLAVVVHIHGGLFMYGSGHSYAHPEYFMDENVIFVTLNYRVGVFGFLSTGDDVISGNNGLKDQVMALKWVKDNIGSFGGDPSCVTLHGLSTGGSCVHLHYLSPMSHGLFQRGFSQSGVALNSFVLQDEAARRARMVGEGVGCPMGSTNGLVECLKARPARHILGQMPRFFGYKFLPVAPFGPVLEKGPKGFVTKNLYYLLATGQVQDLPWMVSSVTHEGLFPTAFLIKELDFVNKNWTEMARYILDYNDTLATPMWKTTAQKIRNFYFEDEEISEKNFEKLVKLVSDRFLVDVDSAIKLQAKSTKSPVYYYQFGFPSDSSTNKTVAHSEDAQYFFYNMFQKQPTPNELKIKDVLMEMFLSFVKNGKPKIFDIDWPPVKAPDISFVKIDGFAPEDVKVETLKELGPRDFWKSLGFLENQNLVLLKDEL